MAGLFISPFGEHGLASGFGFLGDVNSWWVDSNWKRLYELGDVFGARDAWM